jgi:myo-inositol 2-dehydrogenase / D-chiro-inositol 1-dehydrogenase
MKSGTPSESIAKQEMPRRSFLKKSAAAGAAAAIPFPFVNARYGLAAPEPIRVGVVGCGGRGTGAALNVLQAKTEVIYPPPRKGYHTENAVPGAKAIAENVEIIALADVFRDRLEECRVQLRAVGTAIRDEHCFVGFDACANLLQVPGLNYVILATPPVFRPRELRAAIEAGKHVFMEKPAAVDAPGVRSVLESGEMARQKNLGIVAGTVRRHSADQVETVRRIHDGAIGEIVDARAYFNIGEIWMIPREAGWGQMEWQLRNWPYFTWASGDILVEQHIHTIDLINWIVGAHPVRAYGMGGRLARPSQEYGHIYDHFAIEYEYPGGVLLFSQNRQIDGCTDRIGADVLGSKGRSNCENKIQAEREWVFKGQVRDPYEQEHIDLIESIRSGKPLNEAKAVAESTLAAIMGRESAYSGQEITWEAAMKSKRDYTPKEFTLGDCPFPEVPMPRNYRFY